MKYMLFKQLKCEKGSGREHTNTQMANKGTQNPIIVQSKYFQNSTSKKSKRFRSAFTTEQINYLEREFKKFPYIGSANRKEVANKLKIPERAVKIWFQNRRMKEKKESANKELEHGEICKDVPPFTNESLNNAHNWQSNNDRCCPVERAKTSPINFSNNLIIQATTNGMKINRSPCPSIKSPTNSKEDIQSKNCNNLTRLASKPLINTDPALRTLKYEPKVAYMKKSKQESAKVASIKNQSKDYTNYCSLSNRYRNVDQDMPQDLSSRNIANTSYLHHHTVNSVAGKRFFPVQTQSYQPEPLAHGNVIWRPVNMVPSLAGISTSVSMAVPDNSARIPVIGHNIKSNCSCNCNCHATTLGGFNHVDTTRVVHPQYVIAIPYTNHSK